MQNLGSKISHFNKI